ncbi:MAG: CinA family nicotinamide mononucleotide deamidase-related protein [Planctomycetota bacterium]|nr:CinA family nicotinamide mononucleotide deamidase-related protein [Planctomycetota bacterium]
MIADESPGMSNESPLQFRVGVIAVGEEILVGRTQESHGRSISRLLTPLGFEVCWHMTVADAPGALSAVLQSPPVPVSTIIISGGLGPTEDDRSRQEIADAAGVPLEHDEQSWQQIQHYLDQRGITASPSNRRQASRPRGGEMLVNDRGTAPGLKLELTSGETLFALPGVPAEFDAMFAQHLLPWANSLPGLKKQGQILEFIGIPESKLDEWIVAQVGAPDRHHICVRGISQIEVRLPVGLSLEDAATQRFGARFLGVGGIGVESHLVTDATQSGQTITMAESCTGGMIAARITEVPGSSAVFPGAWVCYSNRSKQRDLGVDPALMEQHGAVSQEVVEALAEGALARSGADLALSVSGLAGPGGGTQDKPVGTVWMGLSTSEGTRSHCYRWTGDRQRIRELTTNLALHVLLTAVRGQEIFGWNESRS